MSKLLSERINVCPLPEELITGLTIQGSQWRQPLRGKGFRYRQNDNGSGQLQLFCRQATDTLAIHLNFVARAQGTTFSPSSSSWIAYRWQ